MNLTRIQTQQLQADVAKALQKLDEIRTLLDPYLVVIAETERVRIPRVRDSFEPAARALARAIGDYPAVITASGFEAAAVLEDLDNVDAIRPLAEKVAELEQRLVDSKLVWQAEAYTPSLVAYGVAKALSKTQPELRTITGPLSEVFASRRSRDPEPAPKP